MKEKVCECGCSEFIANQLCVISVIVNSNNRVVRDCIDTIDESSEYNGKPYGGYSCKNCDKQYINLTELTKKRFSESITIPKNKAIKIQSILNLNKTEFEEYIKTNNINGNKILLNEIVVFENGYNVDIKVTINQFEIFVNYKLFNENGIELSNKIIKSLFTNVEFTNDNCFYDLKLK